MRRLEAAPLDPEPRVSARADLPEPLVERGARTVVRSVTGNKWSARSQTACQGLPASLILNTAVQGYPQDPELNTYREYGRPLRCCIRAPPTVSSERGAQSTLQVIPEEFEQFAAGW